MRGNDYVREWRANRVTGHTVTLYDTSQEANVFDPEGGRWVTYCEAHGMLCNHATLALARSFLSAPWNWCEVCANEIESD